MPMRLRNRENMPRSADAHTAAVKPARTALCSGERVDEIGATSLKC